MIRQNFNADWTVEKGDGNSRMNSFLGNTQTKTVHLPYDAMIHEARTPDTKNGAQTGFYPGGEYIFQKHFTAPQAWQGKPVSLVFEGVYQTALVYLNGWLLTRNVNGYAEFTVEAGPYLKYGADNLLKVIADNSLEPNSRWYTGSGIYRPVRLLVGNKVYLPQDTVRITTREADEGFALLDGSVEEPMKAAIRAAGAEGDSVGGVLETASLGLPAGVGEPYFDSVESKLAHLAFSIPAVKGIEFGSGFGFADQKGSEANDAFRMQGERIVTATNHNAGLNGGISNGMPVVFRTAVKPTPSISNGMPVVFRTAVKPTPSIYKTQDTVDYIAKKDAELSIQGRHDPCIVPRAAIVQTCAAALAVGDLLTAKYGMAWMEDPTGYRKEVL